jgi:hypothetical protein
VRATAVVQFARMRPGPAQLVLPWYSDDFDIAADDFVLAFRVP